MAARAEPVATVMCHTVRGQTPPPQQRAIGAYVRLRVTVGGWELSASLRRMHSRRHALTQAGSYCLAPPEEACTGADRSRLAPLRAGTGIASLPPRSATASAIAATAALSDRTRWTAPALHRHVRGPQCVETAAAWNARLRTCPRGARLGRRHLPPRPTGASVADASHRGQGQTATCGQRRSPNRSPTAKSI